MTKKRIISLLFVVALLLGCCALSTAAAEKATAYYKVGYAKVDISPEDASGVIPVPMAGYGSSEERLAKTITDRLYSTCTAVVDAEGNLILYVTMDVLNAGYGKLVKPIRDAIIAKFATAGVPITASQIMVTASHTHSAPDFNLVPNYAEGTRELAYYNNTIAEVAQCALSAYQARENCTMQKGIIDASVSSDYQLNAVRHYNITSYKSGKSVTHVAGDNFGLGGKKVGDTYGQGTSIPAGLRGNIITSSTNVSAANDQLLLLQFTPVSGSNKPIVLANWRAHPAMEGGAAKTNISSDYVGAFRTQMEKAGYRAAFIQGASGNINTRNASIEGTAQDWRSENANGESFAVTYGKLLKNVAVDALTDKGIMQECDLGAIQSTHIYFQAKQQKDSEGLIAASAHCDTSTTYPFAYTHTDGKTYIINSKYHDSSIASRAGASGDYFDKLEYNVIAMGEDVMILTAPNELFDRYDANGSVLDADNDWLELENPATYGTPFVMGYANNSGSYVPNTAAYDYNKDGGMFGTGSYEANITNFAQGEGERLIQAFKSMINSLTVEEVCPACGKTVRWESFYEGNATYGTINSGTYHYRLGADIPALSVSTQKTLADGATVCIDLNGYTYTNSGRSFNLNTGATLNLIGPGKVVSYTGNNNVSGGLINMSKNSTLNVYAGVTLQSIADTTLRDSFGSAANPEIEIENGGVIYNRGTVYLEDATVIGCELKDSSYTSSTTNRNGAAIYVNSSGTLTMKDTTVLSGSGANSNRGNCVYVASSSSRIEITGDTNVDEIYMSSYGKDSITVKNAFTGNVALKFSSKPSSGSADIGNTENADLSKGNLTFVAGTLSGTVNATDGNLYIGGVPIAQVGSSGYSTLQAALDRSSSDPVVLLSDVTEDVTVKHNDKLMLNGYDVNGTVTVNSGVTLSVGDNKTDDFTVADGDYGVIKKTVGKVIGLQTTSGAYVRVDEAAGTSFHLAEAKLTGVALRAGDAGMYYTGAFQADEKVQVAHYGVALSIVGVPTEENMDTYCEYTGFTDWKSATVNSANGTLLKNVMKESLDGAANNSRAKTDVYGRSYICLADGTMIFGDSATNNLHELVIQADTMFESLTDPQKAPLIEMYNTFATAMQSWNLPNMKGEPYKVLMIGQSTSQDSVWLLYDVLKAEMPDREFVVGDVYLSLSLAEHIANIESNAAVYEYYENSNGTMTKTENYTIKAALEKEDWDLIIFNEGTFPQTIASNYTNGNIEYMIDYIAETAEPGYKLAYNVTMAIPVAAELYAADRRQPPDNFRENFVFRFGGDRLVHFARISENIKTYVDTNEDFDYVFSGGTAIQYASETLGVPEADPQRVMDLYRDYIHMSDFGRLMVAYQLYAQIFGLDELKEVNVDLIPEELRATVREQAFGDLTITDEHKDIIIQSVNYALENPNVAPPQVARDTAVLEPLS